MYSTPLIEALAKHFSVNQKALEDYLNHPLITTKVDEFMKDKHLRTIYKNKAGEYSDVKYSRLSLKSAHEQFAYNGYLAGMLILSYIFISLL